MSPVADGWVHGGPKLVRPANPWAMLPPGWVQVAPGGMGFGAGDHRVLLADLMEEEAYSQLGLEEVKYDVNPTDGRSH